MDKHHADVPYYRHQVAEEAQLVTQMLEQVKVDPKVLTKKAAEEEHQSHEVQPKPWDVSTTGAMEAVSDTEDSSSDSSTSDDSDTQGQEESSKDPLTFEQLQVIREGATALCGQPTVESLMKYYHTPINGIC